MSRVWLAGVALAAALAVFTGVGPAVAAPPPVAPVTKKAPAPSLSLSRAIPGERVTVTGRLPAKGARVVRVEQRRSGVWTRVAKTTSAKSGAYTARFRVARAGKVRVVAPKRKKLKAVTSAGTPLRIAAQSGTLEGPGEVFRYRTASYSASFVPARPGRAVVLQVLRGEAWVVVESGVQDASGGASFAVTPEVLGEFRYRVRTLAAGGAPAFATPEARLEVRSEFGWTTRVSPVGPPCDGDDGAREPSMSRDGRYVVFECAMAGVPDLQVVLWDRAEDAIESVSVDSASKPGDGDSQHPVVSADGRYVAYESAATNLVASDKNKAPDIFVWDREERTTSRISVDSNGREAEGGSYRPAISADGRHVAYQSEADNLVKGDENGGYDVFVWDRADGAPTLASPARFDDEGYGYRAGEPSISDDGTYVAYESYAPADGPESGRVDVLVWDEATKISAPVATAIGGGRPDANTAQPSISGNGNHVVFESRASNLVPGDTTGTLDVFSWDRATGATRRVSNGSGSDGSRAASISADGRFVVYQSDAPDLLAKGVVPPDTNGLDDIFVWDRKEGTTRRINLSARGAEADKVSSDPVISDGGRYVAYDSLATTLIDGETNDETRPKSSVYLWDRDN